jgi:hypothetical protein
VLLAFAAAATAAPFTGRTHGHIDESEPILKAGEQVWGADAVHSIKTQNGIGNRVGNYRMS